MTMRARTCPTHRSPMQRVILTTGAEKDVEIDRCGDCGALWFDAGELEQLTSARAVAAGPGFEHVCPSCSDASKDPVVGGVYASARCSSCDGTFLDAATVSKLGSDQLPQLPEAKDERPLSFVCGQCEKQFPYGEARSTALGLVCAKCLAGLKEGGRKPLGARELGGVFDAVLRFLAR
jgi:Zn-finger nucleic acid-binding protein